MAKTYHIRKAESADLPLQSKAWEQAESAWIDCFPWDESGFKPKTEVRGLYDANGLGVRFISDEVPVVVKADKLNGTTYKDSCVEFFFNAAPETSQNYMNFEINAAGVFLLGFGSCREARSELYDIDVNQFHIEHEVNERNWQVKIYIPFAFLKRFYPEVSNHMKGNFQKCGDDTPRPHYGMWNPIKAAEPDFHRPECFGELILE